MKKLFILSLIVCCSILFSCEDDVVNNDGDIVIYEGNYYVSATIDDTHYMFAGGDPDYIYSAHGFNDGFIIILAYVLDNPDHYFEIQIFGNGPGTYSTSDGKLAVYYGDGSGGEEYYADYDYGDSNMVLTIDTYGGIGSAITGTFSGIVTIDDDYDSDSITISDGVINVVNIEAPLDEDYVEGDDEDF